MLPCLYCRRTACPEVLHDCVVVDVKEGRGGGAAIPEAAVREKGRGVASLIADAVCRVVVKCSAHFDEKGGGPASPEELSECGPACAWVSFF